jgi:hypothetical protein
VAAVIANGVAIMNGAATGGAAGGATTLKRKRANGVPACWLFGHDTPAKKRPLRRIFWVDPPVDQTVEVKRHMVLGARRVDIGQGAVTWVAMADPEGNEFCILTPRDS